MNEKTEKNMVWAWFKHLRFYLAALAKWLVLSLITGIICGLIGTLFHVGVEKATELRAAQPWLLYCLPAAGVIITAIYKVNRTEGLGTDAVIDEVQSGKGLKLLLLPSIFFSTILTHLCGGSAGREGAALQMGGTIGYHTGRLFRLDDRDMRVATMVGMAAFFSALFGTPLAAAIFAIMVISVGVFYHAAFFPCFVASLTAYGISLALGVEPTRFAVDVPELEVIMLLKTAFLAILCALVSVLFCEVIHFTEHAAKKLLKNKWIRAAVGGIIIVLLSLLLGHSDYNGAGMKVITSAIESGTARPYDFVLKLIFTAITLACGYKGGEVVPSFFVGATFGCIAGPILGIPAGFAAAFGLITVFCGATNCPIASIFLAVELFGAGGLIYYALGCCMSYMLSGYSGLYSSQKILYSKLKAVHINVHTNAHHAGEQTEAMSAHEKLR